MSEQYFLPEEVARRVNASYAQCKNLGLILDKYVPRRVLGQVGDERGGGERSQWLKDFTTNNRIDPRLMESVSLRWRAVLQAVQARQFTAKTDWRTVVGLGGETVLETDLTLHSLYGIPFIPGSALKGLTRAYVTGEVEGHKSKKLEEDDKDVQRIFGTQKDAGSVIFFDAMPLDGVGAIELDIMNVHYPNYYGKSSLPTNTQNPNPITFLTVANTTFLFALAPRRPKDTGDVELASGWLQDALQKYGVGGKTSAGYGYFSRVEQQSSTPPQHAQKSVPAQYIRPNIAKFVVGQSITGIVIVPTDELRTIAPDAKAFLRYQEWSPKMVLVIVDAEEATQWSPGQTKNCLFVSDEERYGCTVLICKPGASKNKQDKKKR